MNAFPVATIAGNDTAYPHPNYLEWLQHATAEWNTANVYMVLQHNALIATTDNEGLTRETVLDAWIRQESGRRQWGVNSTSYRVLVGGADSNASMGFHQIQNKFLYGKISKSNCAILNGKNMIV